jgi:N-acyl-phosphatidylethanolamine-hydrolysing phospholipase D
VTPSHHRPGGGFRNPWGDNQTHALRGFLRWVLVERLTRPRPAAPDPATFLLLEPRVASPRAAPEQLLVTRIGHASFLLQVGRVNALTDPMWSERASPVQLAGPRRWVAPGIPFEALPPIDLVLLSHDHYDHLDARTVRGLAARHPGAAWLVPLGLARFVRQRGARDVRELDWWQETRVGAALAACSPAQHFSSRGLGDRDATLWCGWSLVVGPWRVFFAGDTGYHPDFVRVGERYGPFDLVLLPIGGYEPRWYMRPVHMNPEEAVRAFRDLDRSGRAVMVPMHWGTFRLTDEPMDEPPVRARAAWRDAGLAAERFWLLHHGESRALEQGLAPRGTGR